MNSSNWLISGFSFFKKKFCKTRDRNYHKPSALAQGMLILTFISFLTSVVDK